MTTRIYADVKVAMSEARRRPRSVSAVMFRVLVLAATVGGVGWVTLHHP